MFFMSLTHSISNLMLIRCYLLFDLYTYFLYIILYHKNLKFKYLINDITSNLWSFGNFAKIDNIRKKL